MKPDDSKPTCPKGINHIQKIFIRILYYARSIDPTIIMALSTLSSEQCKLIMKTIKNLRQLLDYLGTNPGATIKYYASDMILNVHSDAPYLSARDALSRKARKFFFRWTPQYKHPIHLSGVIFTLCHILKFVATSAPEVELGALFLNAKGEKTMRIILQELINPQTLTPIHCNNATTTGIVNGTVKRQQ